jgi:hypothetical protein
MNHTREEAMNNIRAPNTAFDSAVTLMCHDILEWCVRLTDAGEPSARKVVPLRGQHSLE